MSWWEGTVKFIAGGSLVLLIGFLGKSKISYLAGLAVLFPVVTVTGYFFLSSTLSLPELKKTILFSMYSLPTVLVFLMVFYLAAGKTSVGKALLLGMVGWMVSASFILMLNYLLGWTGRP